MRSTLSKKEGTQGYDIVAETCHSHLQSTIHLHISTYYPFHTFWFIGSIIMENSLHSSHLYNMTPHISSYEAAVNKLSERLYGTENEPNSLLSSHDAELSKEPRVPLSENNSLTPHYPRTGLHRPARLDWHMVREPLGKNFSNDTWLKTRRALVASDSDEETVLHKEQKATTQNVPTKLETGYNEVLQYLIPAQESSAPTTPEKLLDITYTVPGFGSPASLSTISIYPSPSPAGTTSTSYMTPTGSPQQHRKQNQNQTQYTYIVVHDAVPLAAESLAISNITGVYDTLEGANGYVERIAEETCREVPEEHLKLIVEDDGGYGFDILDMERHVLHRVHIEKRLIRGQWDEQAEIEEMGFFRGQVDDDDASVDMAKLSL